MRRSFCIFLFCMLAFSDVIAQSKDTLILAIEPAGAGTVSGQGIYNAGSAVNIRATAGNGYVFGAWFDKEGQFYSPDVAIVANSSFRKLTAKFVPLKFEITTGSQGGGRVTGGGKKEYGSDYTLTAVPDAGMAFAYWMDVTNEPFTPISSGPVYQGKVTGNRSISAWFSTKHYQIKYKVNPANGGVTTGPSNVAASSPFAIKAQPMFDTYFVNWTDEQNNVLSSNPDYQASVTADRTFTANFGKLPVFNVTINPVEGGRVNGTNKIYDIGATVPLTAIPNTGYIFQGWSLDGRNIFETKPNYTTKGAKELPALTAFFTKLPTVELWVEPREATRASTSIRANGQPLQANFVYVNGSINLTAIPGNGWGFQGWSTSRGGALISTSANYTYTPAASSAALYANFSPILNFTAIVNPAGAGSVTGAGQVPTGVPVTLIASPAAGWAFVNWTMNGETIETAPTLTAKSNWGSVTANFTRVNVLDVKANPSNGGTVSGGGVLKPNILVTVNATPSPGWVFMNWTDANKRILSQNTQYETSSDARSLIANFGKTFTAKATSGGGTTGSGIYPPNTTINVSAGAQPGFTFVNWTDAAGKILSVSPVFAANSDMGTITASFTKITPVNVTLTVSPEGAGTVTGGGSFMPGTKITLVATPANGRVFGRWLINNQGVSGSTLIYTVPYTNVIITAEFR